MRGENPIEILIHNIFPSGICGIALQEDPEHPGELCVYFETGMPGCGTYWILDTDYKSFASVYSCQDILLGRSVFAWVLTRDKVPSQETVSC